MSDNMDETPSVDLARMWMQAATMVLCAYELRVLCSLQGYHMPNWISGGLTLLVTFVFGVSLLTTFLSSHHLPKGRRVPTKLRRRSHDDGRATGGTA